MVELKKELPEIFEEFAEQRKSLFWRSKKLKKKIFQWLEYFCTYLARDSKYYGCSSCRTMFRI